MAPIDGKENLGRQHIGLALVGEILQRPPHHLFGGAVGINVGGVEKIDAGFQRALEERAGGFFGEDPVAPFGIAIGHGAQTDARDFQAGLAQTDEFHDDLPKARMA